MRRFIAVLMAATLSVTTSHVFAQTQEHTPMNDRYTRGLNQLKAIDGRDGEVVVESMRKISPDFARYLIEYPFGDIYARPQLDLKSREIATIAALTAIGNARPQLEVHIAAGLNVGLTREEILEIIMQMSVYAGFPAAINGLNAAQAVFDRHPEPEEP
ncbi:carboxymuconolactone decarboxylase family protein [Asticcacaulis sp. SL142]|uniref:carboxymuconolactone decarboxylase family protein n=1 Tax=Asticcacaulis sp. SL142 TaxID=2995155 RepID=UPI00226D2F68|nr:carboxymuconolactone decarboxylase family protein [Asticcacaulis sp. SL142]WAC48203.1 carboxymuconolactone decarboxylase family protein [Asticcacaulis sp. SL142]